MLAAGIHSSCGTVQFAIFRSNSFLRALPSSAERAAESKLDRMCRRPVALP